MSLGSCGTDEKTATYRDTQYGWTISYPSSMTRSVVDTYQEHVPWYGVLIANSDRIRAKEGVLFRRFPRDGAAFALLAGGGGGFPDLSPPEQRFPLSRDSFEPVEGAPPPTPLLHSMIANGEPWQAAVWFGPEASSRDKDKIWRVVESIRFPPQRSGSMSGRFYVLGDASHYPSGSVTKFRGKQSRDGYSTYVPAFYLVHAPGGMYAVGWPPKFERKCHMGFARKNWRFFCSTHRGVWSRIGAPLQGPAAALIPNDRLMIGQAKLGRDGQILVGNWSGPANYRAEERRFWPDSG